jgi:abortive infection bacteriophage resistance protein
MQLKKPLTFSEQIEMLISHGMIISDKQYAEEVLNTINYYRLTGYCIHLRQSPKDSTFVSGTDFFTIHKIYQFDDELRSVLRKYIEKVEVFSRTQISHTFAINKCSEPPHNQHYDKHNFYNKEGYKQVMGSIKREFEYHKDSLIVKHHKSKYKNMMPLWALMELISFSNLSKLYNSMYLSERSTIAKAFGVSPDTLTNHLHCLSVLRNKCSHAARLYNTKMYPSARFNSNFLRKNPEFKNDSLFSYVLVLVRRLPDDNLKRSLAREILLLIDKNKEFIDLNLIGFPSNHVELLEKSGGKVIRN